MSCTAIGTQQGPIITSMKGWAIHIENTSLLPANMCSNYTVYPGKLQMLDEAFSGWYMTYIICIYTLFSSLNIHSDHSLTYILKQ